MDITKRKEVEEELNKSEKNLKLIYNTTGDVLFQLQVEPNDRFRFLSVNLAFLTAIGLTEEQIIGKTTKEIIPGPSHTLALEKYKEAIRDKRTVHWEETTEYLTGVKVGYVTVAPAFDEDGNCTHLIGSVNDITEQKQSEQKFIHLLEATPDAMVITDEKGIIRLVNNHTKELFGYAEGELIGKKVEVLIPVSLRSKHIEHRAIYNNEPVLRPMGRNIDIKVLRKDGSELPVDVSLSSMKTKEDLMVIATLRDITERKKAEQSLQKAYQEIEQLKNELVSENIYLREEIKSDHNFEEIIGSSPALTHTLYKVTKVGPTDSTVLIEGETGTGKELIARSIHNLSSRKEKPLIKLNCATIPANLIESELFGHDKGAFTGADKQKTGRFKIADGATLFLDEIGELPLELQPKLLRVLQEGEFEPLGSSKTVKVDVRIIAATNRILKNEVNNGRFRNDLFYRLNVYTITVPPLRERIEDIPLLVQFFIKRFNKIMGKKIGTIPSKTLHIMQKYSWPGNVRELHNIIERAMIESENNKLRLNLEEIVNIPLGKNSRTLADIEREHIIKVLKNTNWRIEGLGGAAEVLGLKPTTLRDHMKRHGITRPV